MDQQSNAGVVPSRVEQVRRSKTSLSKLDTAWRVASRLHRTRPSARPAVNPWVFDRRRGLGLLARVHLLRDVFRTLLNSDDDGEWVLELPPQAWREAVNGERLGNESSKWPSEHSAAARHLRDPTWRRLICEGRKASKDSVRVRGLNDWFGDRYKATLPKGMTPELVFDTPFFGDDAPTRYLSFLICGVYSPGVNDSLLPAPTEKEPARSFSRLNEVVEALLSDDHCGKPLVTLACQGWPSRLSQAARQVVDGLRSSGKAVCYLPLARHVERRPLDDSGYLAIVETLHRFVTGQSDLVPGEGAPIDPNDVGRKLDEVRTALSRTACVLIFDGYRAPPNPYPAVVDFIRDEPLGRVLRQLQHPDPGLDGIPPPLDRYRASFFLVIGELPPPWLTSHRRDFLLQVQDLPVVQHPSIAFDIPGWGQRDSIPVIAEWQSDLLVGLLGAGKLSKDDFEQARNADELILTGLRRVWDGLAHWAKIFLHALALTETGLRWSTAVQVIDAYARVTVVRREKPEAVEASTDRRAKRREHRGSPEPGEHERPLESFVQHGVELFREFLEQFSRSPAILVHFADSGESNQSEPFDFPSQAISFRVSDASPWRPSRDGKRVGRMQAIDYASPELRKLFLELAPADDTAILRRILCELALQAYRIRARSFDHSHSQARRTRARLLIEALWQGLRSLGSPHYKSDESSRRKNWAIHELPVDPAAIYVHLYFNIYRDLLCEGDLTSVGRKYGNGDVELELLAFTANPATADAAHKRSLDAPVTFFGVPGWLNFPGTRLAPQNASEAIRRHILALCMCARRATRLSVLEQSLKLLKDRLTENKRSVGKTTPRQAELALAYQKYRVDHSLHTSDRCVPKGAAEKILSEDMLSAFADCFVPKSSGRAEQLLRVIYGLHRTVDLLLDKTMPSLASPEPGTISPQDLDKIVVEATEAFCRLAPPSHVPLDGIALLTRFAVLTGYFGDIGKHTGGSFGDSDDAALSALKCYMASIALFQMAKRVATKRAEANPLAPRSRISSLAAEEFARVTYRAKGLMLDICPSSVQGFRIWLHTQVRSTLDVFTREQSNNPADVVAMQILEASFARQTSPSFLTLAGRANEATLSGDDRLLVINRALKWLSAADKEVMSMSGRPQTRVALCNERISCCIHALSWTFNVPRGRLTPTHADPYVPYLQWIRHDLHQMQSMIDLMQTYSADAQLDRYRWCEHVSERVDEIRSQRGPWQLGEGSEVWKREIALLDGSLVELSNWLASRSLPPHRLT